MLYKGDCLEIMGTLSDNSIDLILCDLPYGTTACAWDAVIPFEPLWKHYKRLIKDNGAIVLFSSQPFTTDLINSNREWFKYEWIWHKNKTTGIFFADERPMKNHENILVFYKSLPTYNPQKERRTANSHTKGTQIHENNGIYSGAITTSKAIKKGDLAYAKSVQYFDSVHTIGENKTQHPTQKPDELLQYLIMTYTNEKELVMDNTMGSGSTGVACIKTKREFIGIEIEQKYFDIATKRIGNAKLQTSLF